MEKLDQLRKLGQALWYDNIRRVLLDSGELKALIDSGITGVTSNPTIFEKAIAGSEDYDKDLKRLIREKKSAEEIFWTLAMDDIRRTAGLLRPVFDRTGGFDGYVSLEVNPELAYKAEETINEARRLFSTLGQPNVMIKVPATAAGIPAIESLISEGINVNVTLIFSIKQYEEAALAYLAGLEKLADAGGDLSRVASVASFFVSRIDTAVDKALEETGAQELKGKTGIANAKMAYVRFNEIFSGSRWDSLAARGARVQRPLWASTSTKNPLYPDTLYVDNLIGENTVNTVPPATLKVFMDHGTISPSLTTDLEKALEHPVRLEEHGLDLESINKSLLEEGVMLFSKSFESLIETINQKRERILSARKGYSASLGSLQATVDAALSEMAGEDIIKRICDHDHTVWKPEPKEISNRLGWLHIVDAMKENVPRIRKIAENVRADGYTDVLLLGMGGSSLAPEVFRKTFGVAPYYPDLAVLDSTSPGAVMAHADRLDMGKTLFVVSTKSGSTIETSSFFKFFYNKVLDAVGPEKAGDHFIAITDQGSSLDKTAERLNFRAAFFNDPNIGGRYSALSYFGLVPAALIGVDIDRLLENAMISVCSCEPCVTASKNPGAWLGATLGELAKAGRDKITLIISHPVESFGYWVEQLIAESTGKEGKGILPIVGETPGSPELYGNDRLFIYLRMGKDKPNEDAIKALEEAGHPVVYLEIGDVYDLGSQYFLWEMATAVAGHRLSINPFDQPNVESAKVLARKLVSEYIEKGSMPSETPALAADGISVFGDTTAASPSEALASFIAQAQNGAYISLQAYVQPTAQTDAALQSLRMLIRDKSHLATTVGYGPRFLHSTGQLHKGDSGRGLFIQFTADNPKDAPIPDEAGKPDSAISFGVLQTSQAIGDGQALKEAGRKVIRFHLGLDVSGNLKKLSC